VPSQPSASPVYRPGGRGHPPLGGGSMLEKIVILDFGGQYNQLIARRVREAGVYCEIMHYATPMETWAGDELRGVILTGGPNSVYEEGAPRLGKELFSLGVPVLG